MAVTLAQLGVHLRITSDAETAPTGAIAVVLGRVLATSNAMVDAYAPDAPDAIADEAVVRLAGYLYDSDPSGNSPGGPAAMRASGAASLLAPYRVRRGGLIGAEQASSAPTPSTGGPGVDQTARDAIAAEMMAREAADTRIETKADNALNRLMPPSNNEADAATATTIRGWTAALIRRVVEAIVPSWARADDPPEVGSVASGSITGAKLAPDVAELLLPDFSGVDDGNVVGLESGAPAWIASGGAGLTDEQTAALEALAADPTDHTFANKSGTQGSMTTTTESFDLGVGRYLLDFMGQASRGSGPTVEVVDGSTVLASFGELTNRLRHVTRFLDVETALTGLKLRYTWRNNNTTTVSGAVLTVYPLTRTGDGTDQTARAAAASNTRLIRRLQDLTTDLHAGPLSTGWEAVNNDGSQGGVAATNDGTLTGLRAVSAWTPSANRSDANDELAIRVPAGADPRLYRITLTGTGGQAYTFTLNQRGLAGQSADEQWDLYWGGQLGEDVASASMQVTGSLAHLGETRFDGILGDGADGIRASLADVQNRSRDLHLDGAHRLVTNADAAVAGIAAVGILRSQLLAIQDGGTPLDVQGVTFAASIANPDFDAETPTQVTRPVIRLKATENRGDWRLRFVAREHPVDLLAGGWVPITVSNGTEGFDYYISGHASGAVSLLKNTEVTTFHGTLAGGIVKLLNLAAETVARLLPTGGGDGKFLGHADGSPAWVDAPSGGGGTAAAELAQKSSQNGSEVVFTSQQATDIVTGLGNYSTIMIQYSDSSVSEHHVYMNTEWLSGAGGRTVRVAGLQIGNTGVGAVTMATNSSKTTVTVTFPNSGSDFRVSVWGVA